MSTLQPCPSRPRPPHPAPGPCSGALACRQAAPAARAIARVLLAAVILCGSTAMAHAQQLDLTQRRGSFTEYELARLPAYCRDIQGTPGYNGARGKHWRSMMGNDLQHMHHYCRGLRDMMFAENPTLKAADRRFLWERATNEFAYIIRNARPRMILMPEVHYRQGEAYLLLDKLGEADKAFRRARELKPDYWPAYTLWADRLIELRMYDQARPLLEEGLRHSPGSEEIRQRLAKLPGAPG